MDGRDGMDGMDETQRLVGQRIAEEVARLRHAFADLEILKLANPTNASMHAQWDREMAAATARIAALEQAPPYLAIMSGAAARQAAEAEEILAAAERAAARARAEAERVAAEAERLAAEAEAQQATAQEAAHRLRAAANAAQQRLTPQRVATG